MEIININLSGIEDETIISLYFPWGYINEKKGDFGLTHLTEHYIISILDKKYNLIYTDGTINNTETILHFSFKTCDKVEPKQIISDINSIADEIDIGILKNEKKRIEIELEEKYSDILSEMSNVIESQVIDSPENLKRNRISQIKNIKNFKEDDVIRCIKNLLSLNIVVFVGFKGNIDNWKKIDLENIPKISLISGDKFKIKTKNKILKKLDNSAIVFPLPEFINDLKKYYSFKFISEYFNTQLSESIYDLGVYKVEYDFEIDKNSGYLWYFFSSYNKLDKEVKDIVEQVISNIKKSNDLDRNIAAFKNSKIKNLEFNWNDFYGKFDWVVDNFVNRGYVNTLEVSKKAIETITKEDILSVLNEIFVFENMKVGE